jgi:integrase
MAIIRIRYLTTRPGKKGRKNFWWQPSTDLQAAGWKPQRLSENVQGTVEEVQAAAIQEAQRLNESLDNWRKGLEGVAVTPQHGSVEALITEYKRSWRYKELKPKTKKGYEYAFRIIRKLLCDVPVVAITPKMVENIYTSMRVQHPGKAATVIRTLRLLLSYARKEDIILTNPASKPGIVSNPEKGTLWSRAAVDAFVETADAMDDFTVGTAVFLNEWMGQRMGDLISISIGDYKNGKLYREQNKRGAEVFLPVDMVPQLNARLQLQLERNRKAVVASTLLLPMKDGRKYTERHFASRVAIIREKAAEKYGTAIPELKDLIFKDLRHTAVTRLAEAGSTIPEIASVTGHSFRACEEIVDRYNIRTSKMAEGAFQRRLDAQTTTAQKEEKT